jgi:hypothetical protein
MFSTFGEKNLPSIKSNASPSDILVWKRKSEIATCYGNLFKPMDNDDNLTLSCILQKVFPNSDTSNIQIAFAIAVCTTFLNPKYKYINAKESTMRQKVKHYVVGFRNFVLNCNIFLLFTNLLITLKNKLEKRESLTAGNDDDIGSSEEETEEETEELKGTSINC